MTIGQRWSLITVLAALLAFGIGAGWQFTRARRLETQLATAQSELSLTRIENMLALATLEAGRGRYDEARQLTSSFFSAFQESTGEWPAAAADQLNGILALRDSTITVLSRSSPDSDAMLERLWNRYRTALAEPVASTPPVTPATPADSPDTAALPPPEPIDTLR